MIKGRTGIIHSVRAITEACQSIGQLTGDAAEIGVYRGVSARLICSLLHDSRVHLFDTLRGIPDLCVRDDGVRVGDYADTSEDVIRDTLQERSNYELHVGVFPETAFDVPLRFVHIDCDIYQTTREALHWGWRNLVAGGVMVDDDYGSFMCKGAKRAVDEFVAETRDARMRLLEGRALIHKEA